MLEIFVQISLLILAVLIVSFITRLLKQPLIIAYIITGIVIASFFLTNIAENETVQIFSQMGIAFLLFMVGMYLNPRVIKQVGFISIVVGLIQMIFTAVAGYFIASFLGFTLIQSIFIALALTFSSTIIITKILSDKGDLESLYGKISVGILILQDIVVIAVLIIMSYFSGNVSLGPSINSLLYAAGAILLLVIASISILPRITGFVAKNQEILFLFSVGWCFSLAALFYKLGLSLEIGALLAGMSLSISPYHAEIASKIKPLRDFFIIIFFVSLGMYMPLKGIGTIIKPALIFSGFVIVLKFLVISIPLGIAGYTKRTSFLTATSLGQISEFSFIMVALGISLGLITQQISSLVILIGIITIAFSSYMMIYSNTIFNALSKPLNILEKSKVKERKLRKKSYEYILFGYNRIGFSILKSIIKLRKSYVIVDYNPETVKRLNKKRIECVYGDAQDMEFLESLTMDNSKLVLSTIPDFEINLLILNMSKKANKNAIVILTSHTITDAFKLYDKGADYVVLPHFLGGQYTAKLIERGRASKELYAKERKKQIETLKERLEEGQEHPEVGKDHH